MASTTKIGVVTATIIGMNAMIGSGIFSAPAALASNVGPAGILAYLFVVGAVWCMAFSLARLSELFPQEGSFYAYTRSWLGHSGGMFAALFYIVGLIIAMGLLSQIAGSYLHALVPSISITLWGIITLIILVILNIFGVVLSQFGQHILIVCTVFPLLAITALCFSKFNTANLFPFAPHGFLNVLKATRIVIFGFFGFECASSLFAIVENPEKNVAKALAYSIAIVGLLYTLFITSLICAVPREFLSNPEVPLSTTLTMLFPQYSSLISTIHIAILSAILGTIHSMIWSSSALSISLLKNIRSIKIGYLSSPRAHSIAVLCIGLGILITCTTIHNINMFFSLTALFIVTAYILSILALLTIKTEWQSGRNLVTVLGIITAGMIFYFAVEELLSALIVAA